MDRYKIQEIARVAHEINAAYCRGIGDNSQLPWKDAPQWQKDSAYSGVVFHIQNPDAGPEASHNNWLKEKTDAGWVYGPEKDADRKVHHCMVIFGELPEKQQVKDYLFRQVVHSMQNIDMIPRG